MAAAADGRLIGQLIDGIQNQQSLVVPARDDRTGDLDMVRHAALLPRESADKIGDLRAGVLNYRVLMS